MKKYELDKDSIKCCMADGDKFQQYLFGIARIIFYQGDELTAEP